MLFFLSTPQYKNTQLNTTKVRVHLRNGIAEIYDLHQDLMGKVENNIVEIETNFENKLEKFVFLVQEGVFIVSTKGLENNANYKGTGIYLYGKSAYEVGPNLLIEDIVKQYDLTKIKLEKELERIAKKQAENPAKAPSTYRMLLIKEDVEFFARVIIILKDLRK